MSNPNTSSNKTSGRSEDIDIDKEVQHLLKKNPNKSISNYAIIESLKTKYKDEDIVDSIFKKYTDKQKKVSKIADKIKTRLFSKYPNLSQKEYIEKISRYQKKYELDDNEINAIINMIFTKKYESADIEPEYNEMSKALGFIPASYNLGGSLNVKKDELEHLQAILTMAGMFKELHNQVTLQSYIYEDCSQMAITKLFDKNKINVFSFVHPVLFALYFPKFHLLEQHTLMASIAEIIAYKRNNQELKTMPEYELYWDIATDPAETACINRPKPFADLVSRCNIQTKLWEGVLALRQGKYYTQDLSSFLTAIDNCKASIFDAADLAFVKDEGTIVRKLLGAFSIRPTIVLTRPITSLGFTNIVSNITPVTTSHITTLSMITIRLPVNISNTQANEPPSINLQDGLNQQQLYIHNKQFTVKEQSVLYSREILIFYVHRRYSNLNTTRYMYPYRIGNLPYTLNEHETAHKTNVSIEDEITIGENNFKLKSWVEIVSSDFDIHKNGETCATKSSNIILSCRALVIGNDTTEDCTEENIVTIYDPLQIKNVSDNIKPIFTIKDIQDIRKSQQELGTLFIYKNVCKETNKK